MLTISSTWLRPLSAQQGPGLGLRRQCASAPLAALGQSIGVCAFPHGEEFMYRRPAGGAQPQACG